MSDTPSRVPVTVRERREHTIDALCRHFANDALTVDEFERRVDLAHRASNIDDLARLLEDLPELGRPSSAPAPAGESAPGAAVERAERGYVVAIMGGATRKGRWAPAQRTLVYTTWGGVELDFREAELPPGVTELTVCAVMGGVEILVPPGLAVDSDGVAIAGGFDQIGNASAPTSPDQPVLRIRGFTLMGGMEIKVRLPGESARDAKRRERDERRLREAERRLGRHGY